MNAGFAWKPIGFASKGRRRKVSNTSACKIPKAQKSEQTKKWISFLNIKNTIKFEMKRNNGMYFKECASTQLQDEILC